MNIQPYPLSPGEWCPQRTKKKFVVWHGTGGRTSATPGFKGQPVPATASIDAWKRDAKLAGAPYLIDRDGTIYQTFDDAQWIHHLGLAGTAGWYDRRSVAIEFACELGLTLDGGRLHALGMNTPQTIYQGSFFHHPWRGYDYQAQLDEAQVDAGIELTLDICRRHGIEPTFFCPSTSYDFPRCFQVATIVCHSNVRADAGDLCLPEWVYEKMEAAGIRMVT